MHRKFREPKTPSLFVHESMWENGSVLIDPGDTMDSHDFDDRGESSVRNPYTVVCSLPTGLVIRTFHASSPVKALMQFVDTIPGEIESLPILVSGTRVSKAFTLTRKTYQEYDEIALDRVPQLQRLLRSALQRVDREARRFPPKDPDT